MEKVFVTIELSRLQHSFAEMICSIEGMTISTFISGLIDQVQDEHYGKSQQKAVVENDTPAHPSDLFF